MNDIDKMPSKCRDCLCWEIAEAPYVCADCETRRKKRQGEFIRRSDVMRAFADRVRDSNNSDFARAPNWNDAVRIVDYFPAADVEPKRRWIPVEDGLPQERDTIFARFYGTEKWKPGMIRRVSDDVRVVAVFDDGTAMVWHDHTVDGVWSCEKYEINLQRKITHWMENPELPKEQEEMK